jgi:hypothetical protein
MIQQRMPRQRACFMYYYQYAALRFIDYFSSMTLRVIQENDPCTSY